MKIIELLNKIANGEDVPKNIKFMESKYKYLKETKKYVNKYNESLGQNWMIDGILNDEVEIIEDEELKMFEQEWFDEKEGTMSIVEVDLAVKINEIIKKVNSIEQK